MIGPDIKEIFAQGHYIEAIYYGSIKIWGKVKEVIASCCYNSGKWLGNQKWTNNDKWKAN